MGSQQVRPALGPIVRRSFLSRCWQSCRKNLAVAEGSGRWLERVAVVAGGCVAAEAVERAKGARSAGAAMVAAATATATRGREARATAVCEVARVEEKVMAAAGAMVAAAGNPQSTRPPKVHAFCRPQNFSK